MHMKWLLIILLLASLTRALQTIDIHIVRVVKISILHLFKLLVIIFPPWGLICAMAALPCIWIFIPRWGDWSIQSNNLAQSTSNMSCNIPIIILNDFWTSISALTAVRLVPSLWVWQIWQRFLRFMELSRWISWLLEITSLFDNLLSVNKLGNHQLGMAVIVLLKHLWHLRSVNL